MRRFIIVMAWPLLFFLATSSAEALGPTHRTFDGKHAMFDGDIPYWAQKDYVDRTLQRLKDAGFNVYMPLLWEGRGTAWPSRFAPWDPHIGDRPQADFDPFKYVVDKAHAMGFEVHASFTLTHREGDLFPEFAEPGTPADAFDVHHEGFRRLLVNLIVEVIERYDVDGINLDYVRAIGLCTSVRCREEYRRLYNRDLDFDTTLFKLTFGKSPTSLAEYQEQAVTAMVKGICDEVRRRKPGVLISVAAAVGQLSADQGQNTVDWSNRGIIDVIFRMDYLRKIDVNLADTIRAELLNPDALTLMISNLSTYEEMKPGQKHFSRDGKWLADTLSQIRIKWPHTGTAIYMYKYLTDEQVTALKTGPYRIRAGSLGAPEGVTVR